MLDGALEGYHRGHAVSLESFTWNSTFSDFYVGNCGAANFQCSMEFYHTCGKMKTALIHLIVQMPDYACYSHDS